MHRPETWWTLALCSEFKSTWITECHIVLCMKIMFVCLPFFQDCSAGFEMFIFVCSLLPDGLERKLMFYFLWIRVYLFCCLLARCCLMPVCILNRRFTNKKKQTTSKVPTHWGRFKGFLQFLYFPLLGLHLILFHLRSGYR